jgi:hypothetical protein
MILVAGGDSFVWGSELQDSPHEGLGGHSLRTFPGLLAKDHEYQCAAYPGNANDSIARMTMIACEKNKNKKQIALVSWTFPNRYEFRFNIKDTQRWEVINTWSIGKQFNDEDAGNNLLVNKHKIKTDQLGIGEFSKCYFANVGFLEYWETYSTLKEIVYLQNYFKTNNIPYLFTCADAGVLNNWTIANQDDTISCLYNQIDWKSWFFFPAGQLTNETLAPRGFYQWAVENKYKVGDTHPLEDAHRDAAELIKEKFNELVKKSI